MKTQEYQEIFKKAQSQINSFLDAGEVERAGDILDFWFDCFCGQMVYRTKDYSALNAPILAVLRKKQGL